MNSWVKQRKIISEFVPNLISASFLFIEYATNAVELQHKEHINHNIKAIKDDRLLLLLCCD